MQFKSLEEEMEFGDTHDATEFEAVASQRYLPTAALMRQLLWQCGYVGCRICE
jgi:hypothetical protein